MQFANRALGEIDVRVILAALYGAVADVMLEATGDTEFGEKLSIPWRTDSCTLAEEQRVGIATLIRQSADGDLALA